MTAPSTSDTSSGRARQLILLEHRELSQPTGLGAQAGARETRTEMAHASSAVVAATADDGGHDGDPVTDNDVLNIRSDFHDRRGELVPERLGQRGTGQRMRSGRGDDRTDEVLMQVGATDAAVVDLDEYVIGLADLRNWNVFDPDVALAVETGSSHRCSLLESVAQVDSAANAAHLAVEDGGDDDQRALEDVLPGLGQSEERRCVQRLHDQPRAEQGADERASPSRKARAPEHHRRDAAQCVADTLGRIADPQLGEQDQRTEEGEHRRQRRRRARSCA